MVNFKGAPLYVGITVALIFWFLIKYCMYRIVKWSPVKGGAIVGTITFVPIPIISSLVFLAGYYAAHFYDKYF